MEPLPCVFFFFRNDFGYYYIILWVVTLLEACDVTKHGRHFERRLGFYQELEIRYKPREFIIFFLCLTCVK